MRYFYSRAELAQMASLIVGDLLEGRQKQEPYTESSVQNYKIGSRLVTPDGLVWHYGRADAVGVSQTYRRRGVVSAIIDYNYKILAAAPSGSTQIVIDDTAARAKDYWAGGHASIFPLPGYLNDQPRMIKSSTPGNGTSVTLTLYYPIHYALKVDDDVYCVQSPYSEIREAISADSKGYNMALGWTYIPVTPLYYAWVHTWGICQSVHTGTKMGEDAGDRDVYFNYNDGTVYSGMAATFGHCQRIGTIIPDTALGERPYFLLQLDP